MRRAEEWPSSTESGLQVCLRFTMAPVLPNRSLGAIKFHPASRQSRNQRSGAPARPPGETARHVIQNEQRMNRLGQYFEKMPLSRRLLQQRLRGLLPGKEHQTAGGMRFANHH